MMNICGQCGGAVMVPGLSYGYAGKVCMCSWRTPVTPMPQAQIDEALVLAMDADKREIERLRAELAASQAREKVLNGLVKQLVDAAPGHAGQCSGLKCREPYCYSCFGEEHADAYLEKVFDLCSEARKAIALPADDTALREMLARAQEEMRERIAQHFDAMPGYEAFGGTIADDIRALEVKP